MVVAGLAFAGQAQDASIIGQVTDESGAVLPGVTVTATSPALLVPQVSEVTSERGEYRLTALPIGTYTVVYELSGFGALRRQDIRLTAGFTARIDVALKVGALAETLTVSGAAPVVDVAATSARTQLTKDTLDMIPTGRAGFQSMMAQAPGVRTNTDFGGATGNPLFRAFGQNGDSWQNLDGVVTTSPKTGNQSGNWFDSNAFEEATITSVGNPAEAPTRGIQLNVIIKSGGNDFHGSAQVIQSGPKLQGTNVTPFMTTTAGGSFTPGKTVDKRWERYGELGGRLVRNRLWFYVNGRARETDSVSASGLMPDGITPCISSQLQGFGTAKVSQQMSPSSKIVGFYQHLHQPAEACGSKLNSYDTRLTTFTPVHTGKVEWQTAKGSQFLSFQYGFWNWYLRRTGNSPSVATTDQLSLVTTGMNVVGATRQNEGRKGVKGTYSLYKPGLLWGNHDFKAGFDYSWGAHADRATFDRGSAGPFVLDYRNGVPFQIEAKSNPTNPKSPINYLGTYFQDSWTIARRLTLNLGVRYAHDSGFLPAQCRVASPAPLDVLQPAQCYGHTQLNIWQPVTPRLHASWDVRGDGKTVVKGGWGLYGHLRGIDEVQMVNNLADNITVFTWHDVNGDKLFQPGEANFDTSGPDFVLSRKEVGQTLANAVPNPKEKEPMTDEFSVTVERQLIPNLAVRATGIYSREHNTYRVQNNKRPFDSYNIAINNPDPGPDGKVGTADDPGTTVTYYEYPLALKPASFQEVMLINDKKSQGTYKSYELAMSKRLSNKWLAAVSFSATKLNIPVVPNTAGLTDFTGGGGLTVILATYDPNAEIFGANHTWEWISRLSGAYVLPFDIQVSANYELRSGDPWARQVSVTGGTTIPTNRQRVEEIGAQRLDKLHILNTRIEKSVRLPRAQKLALTVNFFNTLNINTATTVTPLSSANYLIPTAITPARVAELGMTYSF